MRAGLNGSAHEGLAGSVVITALMLWQLTVE
jgi:hypothetical protein